MSNVLEDIWANDNHLRAPPGYRPLGRPDVCHATTGEIPQSMNELGELVVHAYNLSARLAVELNIPVAGSVSGEWDRQVVVWEWMRYKALAGEGGVECHYGYVIRFCVTVNNWKTEGKVSLPFLTAKVELGKIEAAWMMQIRGLVGPSLDKSVLPPQELSVETFVIAKQSLEKAISAVHDPTTKFVPGVLIARVDPTPADDEYRRAVVRSFGLYSVFSRETRETAERHLESKDPADLELLSEIYEAFGATDPRTRPSDHASEHAKRILRGMRVEKGRLGNAARRVKGR